MEEKLKNATVAIAGLGGLGSNVALSLARIGVGNLILIDFDVIDLSNLNRQQYFFNQVGMKKCIALKENLLKVNPFINIKALDMKIEEENIDYCFKEVDIVVEGFDSAEYKAMLVNNILIKYPSKYIIGASGMAGYFSSNSIVTKKINKRFYLVGDEISEESEDCSFMAPRVAIAANHEANMVLRLILGQEEV